MMTEKLIKQVWLKNLNEEKLTTLEEKATDEMEMAEEAYETRECQEKGEQISLYKPKTFYRK